MKNIINFFKDVYYIYKFFRIKKLFLIFFLFSLCTILETLNIALILPFVGFIFGDNNTLANNDILNFLYFSHFFQIDDNDLYLYISFFIIFLFLIKSVTLILSSKVQNNFFALIRYKISSFFFNFYITKPYIFFLNEKESSKIMRNTTALGGSYAGFLERFLVLVNDFFIFLGVIIIMIYYYPKIFALISIFFLINIFIFVYFTKSRFSRIGKSLLELSASLLKDIQETLNNIIQIKLLNKENFFQNKFDRKAITNSYQSAHLTFLQTIPRILIEFVAIVIIFLLIGFLINNSYAKDEIVQILTLFTIAILRIYPFSIKLIAFLNTVSSFIPSLKLLKNEVFKTNENKYGKAVKQKKIAINKIDKIELNKVEYLYPKTQIKLLENVNLELVKNNIYGIYGPSGSGKTTLLNIICGLIKPIQGKVLYNEKEITSQNFANIAYVSQNSYFQKDTIKNNIAFGVNDDEINEEKIFKSLEDVDLYNLVKEKKEKIETFVSELGANFSGGQLQRLSIARALYADTDVIIFDEPTSFLDQDTKNIVLKKIFELKTNRIIIIISHIKDDMKICSKVFKIENKKVLENEQ